MSFAGKDLQVERVYLTPLSADPVSPLIGDVFYSDGTPRLAGPWVYTTLGWEQISTGAALNSVNFINYLAQATDPSSPVSGTLFNANGSYNNYVFTLTSSQTVSAGAVYANTSINFTTTSAISSSTVLPTTGAAQPQASGTLTKISGAGGDPATLAYSAVVQTLRPAGLWVYDGTAFVQISRMNQKLFNYAANTNVRLCATTNQTLANLFNGSTTIDGVTIATGDKILLAGQTSSFQDGVYTVGASSGLTVRTPGFTTAAQLSNAAVYVTAGSTQADKYFFQANTVIDITVDPQSWSTTSPTQSFTVPEGVTNLIVEAIGGGGAGGYSEGGGGGGGIYGTRSMQVTPGEILSIVLGAGGLPVGSGSGNAGGNTTVTGSLMTLTFQGGGGGGKGGSNGLASLWPGGTPGVGGGGGGSNGLGGGSSFVAADGGGGEGNAASGAGTRYVLTGAIGGGAAGGGGGGSGVLIGGIGGTFSPPLNGSNAAFNSGAGGGGGPSSGNAGAGGNGIVRLMW